MGLLSNLFRARDEPRDSVSAAMPFFFGTSPAGKASNPRTAIQLSAVYACVRVLGETIASLPFGVYHITANGTEKAANHPLYRLIHDEPNHEMTSFSWREAMMSHLNLWGNSYTQIIRDGYGNVIGLYPLLPENMEVDRHPDTNELMYTYTTSKGETVVLRASDVLHIPGLGFDGILGYSPIAMERSAIGLGIAAEEYGSKFFANGAVPSGILTSDSQIKNPDKMRKAWSAAYGGSSNGSRVAVLEEGLKYQQITIPNDAAQFLQTRKFQVDEICRIFRVPPHLIGNLEHATFSNIEHQSIDFVVHTVRPWLVRIEQTCNRQLFKPDDKGKYFVQFNVDGLLRGDYKSRMEGYAIGRQNGWLSANDIRALENQNPIPNPAGDAYLVNGNMISIEQAANAGKEETTNETNSVKRSD